VALRTCLKRPGSLIAVVLVYIDSLFEAKELFSDHLKEAWPHEILHRIDFDLRTIEEVELRRKKKK
jgi:hypothetical protein